MFSCFKLSFIQLTANFNVTDWCITPHCHSLSESSLPRNGVISISCIELVSVYIHVISTPGAKERKYAG